jgi:XRE family transcriptional regulator, aerobic/anaerobic benzoate catabolism transcriptional regulator
MESRPTEEQDFLAELGRRVRHGRALRGMSRKVLARVSGISERYIAQLEGGEGNVSIKLLRRVAAAMGTRVEDLLVDSDAPTDWPVFRDLIRTATSAQIAQARAILAGTVSVTRAPADRAGIDRVALIGLRGAGKSTLGRAVAARLGWSFLELNREIEHAHGHSVAEILALYGQEGYRRREQAALRELVARPGPMIVATGGGVVAEPLTLDLLMTSFFTVWLKAAPEEHMARVRQQGDLRPMADDPAAMQELKAILASREPLYGRARVTVDTSGIAVEAAAERLVAAIAPARQRKPAPRKRGGVSGARPVSSRRRIPG